MQRSPPEPWREKAKIAIGVATLAAILGFFAWGFWETSKGLWREKPQWSPQDIYLFEKTGMTTGKTCYVCRDRDAVIWRKPIGATVPTMRCVRLTDEVLLDLKKAALVSAGEAGQGPDRLRLVTRWTIKAGAEKSDRAILSERVLLALFRRMDALPDAEAESGWDILQDVRVRKALDASRDD